MTAQRHPANRKTGQRGGRKTQEALARLHSARSLNRSQGFTAEGGGSSLAPLGRRSFEKAFTWAKEHGLALALDVKAFEKIASVQALDFVNTEETIVAVIGK